MGPWPGRRIARTASDSAAHSGSTLSMAHAAEARAGVNPPGIGFEKMRSARSTRLPAVGACTGSWPRHSMTPADLYLLDEPTNHLDLDATPCSSTGSRSSMRRIIISPSRQLHRRNRHTWPTSRASRPPLYRGNNSSFERQKSGFFEAAAKPFLKRQKRMAEIQRFVDRFRAKATCLKQVQSRLGRTLEQLAVEWAVHARSPFPCLFVIRKSARTRCVEVGSFGIGYGPEVILEKVLLPHRSWGAHWYPRPQRRRTNPRFSSPSQGRHPRRHP